jgi:hypothetical protein
MAYDRKGDRRSSMLRTRTVGSLVLAATALAVAPLGWPASAEAHGHHGGVYVGVGVGGFYGWGPYWGWGGGYWGWGAPYWGWGPGPYYGAPGGYALGYAMMSGLGALDMNVNPKQAEVWVDGKYVADARDLDGDPSYLWMKQGSHHVVLYKAGFRSFEEDVDVNVGMIRELKVKLEKGESQPPARAATEVRREPPRPESPEPRAEAAESGREPRGDVSLHVEPRDATVYVDGEYRGNARELPGLRLPAGHHQVQLVRPGFQPFEKGFDVEADRTIDLKLSMERGGGWKY